MERYICIHGHFYQPPRENAWLEQIELQDEAYPYHDWNERITAECYAPNSVSRILDREGFITEVTNNYARISFDFGPTLLVWLEKYAPDVYQAVLDADRESKGRFSGHGSALAQAYNHMIMPLANRHDKYTQVRWGIHDFERRFGRRPEGMWLPETAVDLESLDIMAELGIQFTILAPRQASRVREIGSEAWEDVSGGHINPTMAYTLNTPSGRELSVFFYDDPISRAVAFEGLLSDGETFAHRLTDAFSEEHDGYQCVNIATDGETYGHHHRFGDMALAFALHYIESNNLAQITNYGEFLEKHPPTHEVEIFENTSWSCVHGIERWRSDCGCNTGGHPKWNQAWRAPLRQAMDWLRDAVAPQYEEKARQFVKDPWVARDDYINVILDRTPENVRQFLSQHATHELSDSERISLIKLLELQRHAMLMYTSCGWFFDELSSIGTVQVIQYAGRVVQLAGELFGDNTELHFLEILALAKSNIQELGDGRTIYEKSVKPAMVDLIKLTAHYAISSLFEDYGEQVTIYCYSIDVADYQSVECGHTRLAVGKATVTSEITQESGFLSFGVLHFGDHNVNAGIREYQGDEAYQVMVQETTQTCTAADFPEVIRLLDKHFGTSTYSLRDLFQDEQRKVLDYVLESALVDIETAFRQLYEQHYPPMRFLADLGNPLPKAFHAAVEFIINADLRRALSGDTLEAERIQNLLDEANVWNVELDNEGLAYLFQQSLGGLMRRFKDSPEDIDLLKQLVGLVSLARSMPLTVDLWEIQNLYYEMLRGTYPELQNRAQSGDDAGIEWVTQFVELGQHLRIRVG
jgi:alpha-amylase/alpha-mannosidase (GH57 family)